LGRRYRQGCRSTDLRATGIEPRLDLAGYRGEYVNGYDAIEKVVAIKVSRLLSQKVDVAQKVGQAHLLLDGVLQNGRIDGRGWCC